MAEESFGERIKALESALGLPPYNIVSEEGMVTPWALELYHRRKIMLITHYSDKLDTRAIQLIADKFNTTPNTLYQDWHNRQSWEPLIWESVRSIADAKKLVDQLQLARETALELMNNPRISGNARVGAINQFREVTKTIIELLQGLGELPRQMNPAVVVNQNLTQIEATKNETKIMIDFSKMSEDDRKALLRAEEALARAETATGPQ